MYNAQKKQNGARIKTHHSKLEAPRAKQAIGSEVQLAGKQPGLLR
jgi:hypothetical protein